MKKIIFTILVLCTLLLTGCNNLTAEAIKESPDDYVGKEVTLKGISRDSIKLGKLSGFTLEQEDGSKISVSSQTLPEDGSEVKVSGVVVKDTLFGVYILANEVDT